MSKVLDKSNLKRRRSISPKKESHELFQIFWAAPMEAFFGQDAISPVTNKSIKTLECDRWKGIGIPYRKAGHCVLYKKQDVVNWLESHELVMCSNNRCKRNPK